MLSAKNTFGQVPFCSRALISVPGASAPSFVTDSQPLVLKPGVEIWAPVWVAVAEVSTFQPAVPRSVTAVEPVETLALALSVATIVIPIAAASTAAVAMDRSLRFMRGRSLGVKG